MLIHFQPKYQWTLVQFEHYLTFLLTIHQKVQVLIHFFHVCIKQTLAALNITLTLTYLLSVTGYACVDTFYLYFIEHNNYFNLYPLLDWWSVKYACIKTFLCMYTIFTCMILTQWIAEIQRFISEQGMFPSVIVWVWQWGAWKCAPM